MHRMTFLPVVLLLALAPAQAADVVAPNAHLRVDGVPPISAALAAKIAPYAEFRAHSVSDTDIYVLDADSGKRTRVLPRDGETPGQPFASSSPQFSRAGKALFLATDRDGEFQRGARLDLASGKLEYFGPADWRTTPD